MIAEIKESLSEGFEQHLFSAALRNLEDTRNPLRVNNFSYAMRELTRHVLYRLAPDENVLKCSWHKSETDKPDGITRKQRAYYAVQGGLDDSYVENTLGIEVNEIHKNLIRTINRLSKFTHIEPKIFGLPEEEVNKLVEGTKEAVYDFLSLMSDCRKTIVDGLWEQIDSTVIDETLKETILALDELASHYFIDEVYTDTVKIHTIDHELIMFRATGSIYCELQWGSNLDLRRGDGVVLPRSFPFSCELVSPVGQPEDIDCIEGSLGVDTRSWYEGRYDEQA